MARRPPNDSINSSSDSETTGLISGRNMAFDKWMLLHHILALCYNVYTTSLYFNSIDELPQHAQGPNGQHGLPNRMSKLLGDDPSLIAPTIILASLCTVLFYSNQRTFPTRLQRLFDYEDEIPKTESKGRVIDSSISSFFKAITTSTSLYALLSNIFSEAAGDRNGFYIAISGTSICFLGNFFAQFSVFLEHFFDDLTLFRNKPGIRKSLSHYFAISYAISNAALYFNAFDAAPSHIGWIDNRLTKPKTLTEILFLAVAIAMSLNFAYATWQRFEERIYRLISPERQYDYKVPRFDAHERNQDVLFNKQHITFRHKFNCSASSIAAVWKAIVTTGSFVGFMAANTPAMKSEVSTALFLTVITFTSILSFFPQLTLYARSNETIVQDEQRRRSQPDSARRNCLFSLPCCPEMPAANTVSHAALQV